MARLEKLNYEHLEILQAAISQLKIQMAATWANTKNGSEHQLNAVRIIGSCQYIERRIAEAIAAEP